MTNVLLSDWDTPFQIAPFDAISDDDFAPALDIALDTHKAEIDAIAGSDDAPTFANTIEALEASGDALDKVLGTFFTVAGADSNTPHRQVRTRRRHFSIIDPGFRLLLNDPLPSGVVALGVLVIHPDVVG